MVKKIYIFLALVAVIVQCSSFCYGIAAPTPYAMPGESAPNDNGNLDLKGITEKCNETFRIQMDYLKELNETGAFPDETDKTPMVIAKVYSLMVFTKNVQPFLPNYATKSFIEY